ncbi:MAG: hypothetical protein ABS92_01650 [Thiobacillus sp. SCN 63-374]|nr:MAG: hypothetical protein ABS92_01650 [Thiobacillus sp. SCN 63-374]
MTIKTPKKLIEVALPLDDINVAAAREKSIRHGHPSTLHLWWARRPLAAARAVIFAQMVNDPGYERSLGRGVNKEKAAIERERLFGIIRRLVLWENTNNEAVLEEAREEIRKSWRETCELNRNHPQAAELFNPDKLPAFHDPFAGGGALPLEAQRLGLESYATDLNPVAVLINKAMIEIPPRFTGQAPVGPVPKGGSTHRTTAWHGAHGLAEDVRRYGAWMREEAFKRIGHLYPQVDLPKEYGGGKATVIAWLWTRTVKSPNPAFSHVDVPLASTFILSSKAGKEAYVQPVIEGDKYHFEVKTGKIPAAAKNGTKSGGSGSSFLCMLSKTPMDFKYLRDEAKQGRMGHRLMAIVADGPKGRVYLSPTEQHEALARSAVPDWAPDTPLPAKALGFRVQEYGMLQWKDLFTARQLTALSTLTGLVHEVREKVLADARHAKNLASHSDSDQDQAADAQAYADAVSIYLACAIGKVANIGSTIASWMNDRGAFRETFARQAIQMTWDYAEANPFADAGGSFATAVDKGAMAVAALPAAGKGFASQSNASTQEISTGKLVSTDPPYYDNIGYADLSDFFYVWMRRALRHVDQDLFATMTVPKAEELVATPFRHGNKEKAEIFFLEGMTQAMHRLADQAHSAFPTTIYYAFKQSDTSDVGTGNTGWETFLEAVLRAGFAISGTWPMRTEGAGRLIAKGTNALASSIVLVCRKRDPNAATISRRDFLRELKDELGEAVEVMIGGTEGISPVAPVDLAQAVIGPGMAIFSKYAAVLEADGSPMTVHTALTLINRMLVEGDDFDADTQFCLGWFDEQGWGVGAFGSADVMARAKGTSVDGVKSAGVVEAGGGKVRLLKPVEYPTDWSPEQDNRTPVWEALHQMIRALHADGEAGAGALLARMPERSEPIRKLAYRLYTLCERKGWAEEARGYNDLITSWHGIEVASHEAGRFGSQATLDV